MKSPETVQASLIGIADSEFGLKLRPSDTIDMINQDSAILEVLFLMLESEFQVDVERDSLVNLFTEGHTVEEVAIRFSKLIEGKRIPFPTAKRERLAELLREPRFWRS